MEQASPQLENGYTRIANELLEVITFYPFAMSEYKVVWAVIRETYGFQLKAKKLSYGIIAKLTGLSRRQVKRSTDKLVKSNVLFRESDRTGSILGLNKYYLEWSLWKTLKDIPRNVHRVLSGMSIATVQNVHTSMDNGVHTLPSDVKKERNIYKESIKETENISQINFFKNERNTFREHLKEPMHIGEIIKQVT